MKTVFLVLAVLLVSLPAFGQDADLTDLKTEVDLELAKLKAQLNTKIKVKVQGESAEIHGVSIHAIPKVADAVSELMTRKVKKIKVYVQSVSSTEVGLAEAYRECYHRILAEMERREPEAAKKMKANTSDIRGNLVYVETYIGLDKINTKGLSLIERCRRVCWVEGVYQDPQSKVVELIFVE